MSITTGQILKYSLLPGIVPRIGYFFGSGFGYLAFYMAQLYSTMRLLPADHPYLLPQNLGKYGVRHVLFEAKRHLVFKRENIDQILIYFLILFGIILLLTQFAMAILGFLVPMAAAGSGAGSPAYLASFFQTPDPTYDIAYRLLDATFGFNGSYALFNSCLAQGVPCQLAFHPGAGFTPTGPINTIPNGFHNGLHLLFEFYNTGVLAIGLIVFLYLVVAIVAETAQSGTPFGKRFNGAWAPIRLFIAIGLLTPLAFGMNGAQLMTLVIAKWGSSLATNGWNGFISDLAGETLAGAPSRLVATPTPPEMNTIIEFIFIAQSCKHTEALLDNRNIRAYHVFGSGAAGSDELVGKSFLDALSDSDNQDILIRFGVKDNRYARRYKGGVKPICGELTLSTQDIAQEGALVMQEGYYDMLIEMWTDDQLDLYAENVVLRHIPNSHRNPSASPVPDDNFLTLINEYFATDVPDLVQDAINAQIASADWLEDHRSLGWAGAAIWYNKIAEMNGGLFASIYAPPTPAKYTEAMEYVLQQKKMHNRGIDPTDRFNPILVDGRMVEFQNSDMMRRAIVHHKASTYWQGSYEETQNNVFIDAIISVFGLQGLFDMQANLEVHPLAQLVGVGRSLIESSVINFGITAGAAGGGLIAKFKRWSNVKQTMFSAAEFSGKIAMIGLSLGFILYYIIPFLPFIYFFFAVGGWIKSVFEAMVGLPLWAIAHIRIDGEGLPGPAAMNGYFLIFEIFIRPLLIIFGLIAAVSIFTAQVQVLNEIWKLVLTNVTGYDTSATPPPPPPILVDSGWDEPVGAVRYMRGHVDRLFHTIVYVVIVYMMAMASFKLIDLIPNSILRWMGSSVSTFAEQSGDPASSLVRYAWYGTSGIMSGITGGFQNLLSRSR